MRETCALNCGRRGDTTVSDVLLCYWCAEIVQRWNRLHRMENAR